MLEILGVIFIAVASSGLVGTLAWLVVAVKFLQIDAERTKEDLKILRKS